MILSSLYGWLFYQPISSGLTIQHWHRIYSNAGQSAKQSSVISFPAGPIHLSQHGGIRHSLTEWASRLSLARSVYQPLLIPYSQHTTRYHNSVISAQPTYNDQNFHANNAKNIAILMARPLRIMSILPPADDHLFGATVLMCGRSRQVSLYDRIIFRTDTHVFRRPDIKSYIQKDISCLTNCFGSH